MQRPTLTRERVVTAAVELADADGVAALSMRKLATHLGFEVMSLYNHIANKDDLLDAMVDLVAGEITDPDPTLAWKPAARLIAMSAHEALLLHQWAAPMWSSRWPGPNRWKHMNTLLRVLSTADLPADAADLGFHAITTHVQGFTQQKLDYAAKELSDDEMYRRFVADVDALALPHLHAHVDYHRTTTPSQDGFAFVLDLILDGLERASGLR